MALVTLIIEAIRQDPSAYAGVMALVVALAYGVNAYKVYRMYR